jgi:hypothetical protein
VVIDASRDKAKAKGRVEFSWDSTRLRYCRQGLKVAIPRDFIYRCLNFGYDGHARLSYKTHLIRLVASAFQPVFGRSFFKITLDNICKYDDFIGQKLQESAPFVCYGSMP